MMRLE